VQTGQSKYAFMKVLFISSYIKPHSGAGIIWRLKSGLENLGCQCYILSNNPFQHNEIIRPKLSYTQRSVQSLYRKTINRVIPSLYIPFSKTLIKSVKKIDPDIINIHWTHGQYPIPIHLLKYMSKSWPIVWSIHDMWPITGYCFFTFDCNRHYSGCGKCPQLTNSYIPDFSKLYWKYKKRHYFKTNNLFIVAASRWLEKELKESPLHDFKVFRIPYSENTQLFKPYDKNKLRKTFDIPHNAKVVFILLKGDFRKGDDLIPEIFRELSLKINNCYLLLGGYNKKIPSLLDNIENLSYKFLGAIQDEKLLANCYSVADVFLTATRADNMPLTVLESIASGTPVIASDVGGISDVVFHDKTGLLVEKNNISGFVFALEKLLNNKHKLKIMGQHCVDFANKNLHVQVQASKYMELFQTIKK